MLWNHGGHLFAPPAAKWLASGTEGGHGGEDCSHQHYRRDDDDSFAIGQFDGYY